MDKINFSLDSEQAKFLSFVLDNFASLQHVRKIKYSGIMSQSWNSDINHQIEMCDDMLKLLSVGFKWSK